MRRVARPGVDSGRVLRRRGLLVRPLHGPVLDPARGGVLRLRRRRDRDARARRGVRTGCADGRARPACGCRVDRRGGPDRAVRRGRDRASPGGRRPPRQRRGPALRRRHVRRGSCPARRPLHEGSGSRTPRDGAGHARRRDRGRVRVGPRRGDGAAPLVLGRCAPTRPRRGRRVRSCRCEARPPRGAAPGGRAARRRGRRGERARGARDVRRVVGAVHAGRRAGRPVRRGPGRPPSGPRCAPRVGRSCPDEPIVVTARAWAARGTASPSSRVSRRAPPTR